MQRRPKGGKDKYYSKEEKFKYVKQQNLTKMFNYCNI